MVKLLLAFAIGLAQPSGEDPFPLLEAFVEARDWHDGKAEVSTYDSKRTVYGRVREFPTTLVVVKESIGRFSRVKVDSPNPPEPLLDACKLHLVQTFDTENYPYHFAITVLVERLHPFVLIKESVSSQEWCGTTFQQINHLGQAWKYWWNSYWENEGHGERVLSVRPHTEEQLLLALRAVRWEAGLVAEIPVVWGLHGTRAAATSPIVSRVECKGQEEVSVAAGRYTCWVIEVTAEARRAQYKICVNAPHSLVEFTGEGGRSMQLRETKRWAYWQR
ncbi:MAG: hypothetical protein AB7O52_07790 [Planctomycetota bacterium]